MLLKEASISALKEEDSAHPLLRGAKNTAEGFKVRRANILQPLLPDLCSTRKDQIFLCERLDRPIQQGLQGENPHSHSYNLYYMLMG